jgi:hypothetical protein
LKVTSLEQAESKSNKTTNKSLIITPYDKIKVKIAGKITVEITIIKPIANMTLPWGVEI